MVKGKKVLGTLAMDLHTGKRFGRVKNIIVDTEEKRAKALILPGKSWVYPPVWIDIDSVEALGQDILSFDSAQGIISTKKIPAFKDELDKGIRKLWGIVVVTGDGKLAGYLEDLYLEVPGGAIAGIEFSRGFVGDVLQGRGFLPSEQILSLSFESAVVKAEESG